MPRRSTSVNPRPSRQLQVLANRAIARMLVFRRRADQASAHEKLHPRLQVREIGHRDEQFATGPQHAVQLRERARLILVREMFQHVETQARSNVSASNGSAVIDPFDTRAEV